MLVSQRRTEGRTDICINLFLARKQRLKSVSVGETQLVLVRSSLLRWSSQTTTYDSVMMPTLAIKLVRKLRNLLHVLYASRQDFVHPNTRTNLSVYIPLKYTLNFDTCFGNYCHHQA